MVVAYNYWNVIIMKIICKNINFYTIDLAMKYALPYMSCIDVLNRYGMIHYSIIQQYTLSTYMVGNDTGIRKIGNKRIPAPHGAFIFCGKRQTINT